MTGTVHYRDRDSPHYSRFDGGRAKFRRSRPTRPLLITSSGSCSVGDVLQRVALDDDEVGFEAGGDLADLFLLHQHLRVDQRRRLQRGERRQPASTRLATSIDTRPMLAGP